jgi:competence protein ComEA
MPADPPPWRVFDAPTADPSTSPDERGRAESGLEHGPAAPSSATAASSPTVSAGRLLGRPDVVAGTAVALGGLVLAWFLATGGSGGSTSLGGGAELINDPGVVDVVGGVLRPGVYHLPTGSRIADAIAAAGGFGPRVAAERVDQDLNLAAPVHDGQQIVVPSRDETATSPAPVAASGAPGGALINLNTATASELDTLPGVGPVTAAKIVASRSGEPFRATHDLLDRKLVGQKTFDAIKGLVTVG